MGFEIQPIDNRQLSQRIREALIELIQKNCKDDKPFRLPNEDDLARMLGVTRAGLRDVLLYFEQEGYITRRRGVGTIVNPRVANCRSRLDLEMDFASIIEHEGYQPRFSLLDHKIVEAVCESISSERKTYLWIEKVFYADDQPVIYCTDWMDVEALEDAEGHAEELAETPFFLFLQKYAHENRAYVMSDLDVDLPEERVQEMLRLSAGEPILQMKDTMFTVTHTPICYSTISVRRGMLNFKILRRTT